MIPAGTDRKWKNLIYHIQLERFYIMCHHDPHFLKSVYILPEITCLAQIPLWNTPYLQM
jgi:hypothetical protein